MRPRVPYLYLLIAEKIGALRGVRNPPYRGVVLAAVAQLGHGIGGDLIAVVPSMPADIRLYHFMRGHDIRRRIDDILIAEKIGVFGKPFDAHVILPRRGELHRVPSTERT